MTLDDARVLLAKAKDEYARALRAVDARLIAAVRIDPQLMSAAKALQDTYHQGFVSARLSSLQQPGAGRPPASASTTVSPPAGADMKAPQK